MNSRITSWMVFPRSTHTAVNRRLRSSAITGAHACPRKGVAPSTGQATPTLWVPGHASLMLIALRSSANLYPFELADWPEPRSLPSLCLPAKSVHHGKRGWYKTLLFLMSIKLNHSQQLSTFSKASFAAFKSICKSTGFVKKSSKPTEYTNPQLISRNTRTLQQTKQRRNVRMPLFSRFFFFFPLAFLGFSVFFQDLFHPLVTTYFFPFFRPDHVWLPRLKTLGGSQPDEIFGCHDLVLEIPTLVLHVH